MASTVFFSWQSDTPGREGRNFLEQALTKALFQLAEDGQLEEAARDLELDKDTKDVSGSPPIVETIFGKIDRALAVVCDVTFITDRGDGRMSPNPNVLIEYGWALKSRGHARVITVMNEAFGPASETSLPFDMRHLRWPIRYSLPSGASSDEKAVALKAVTRSLVQALVPVLGLTEPVAEPVLFEPRPSGSSPGRWQGADEYLGFLGASKTLVPAPTSPLIWLWMGPQLAQHRIWSMTEVRAAVWNNHVVRPFLAPTGGFDDFREDGVFGVVARIRGSEVGSWSTAAFETGEIWGIDGYRLGSDPEKIWFDVEMWEQVVEEYQGRLVALGVTGPIAWKAGFENCRGRTFPWGRGPCVKEVVTAAGLWPEGGAPLVVSAIRDALKEATI